ncbi:prolipoprotein diacylglyceryl transferase [Minwuia thermotolerans]|uniref:Phosphatidylglycerol--prolipoprotein diacylglyceryl transferase n=1 Tax=Minwuia thermotolerans TaxID=2056226 RepID=A0A2M9G2Q4_9PROT|nr:prolipoprotein diacylglyceryl transferase [Minwuia thermotolerans]PJK29985.1 prolipoprotein diacylglyceryl transferase [Minwuia thermotolerans]
MYAIPFPVIDPVAVDLGPLVIRWYALAYIAGLVIGWRYAMRLGDRPDTPVRREHPDMFLVWATIGIIAGGRLGYVLFYAPEYYFAHPGEIVAVWQGGMSFHGGLLGVVAAGLLFCRVKKIPAFAFGDILSTVAPIGLFFGRIANFVNGELWGRPTDAPWGMIFPRADDQPRHPSQLYEAFLEGLLLFAVVNLLVWRFGAYRRPGLVMGVFVAGYGAARFIVEFFRQWDEGVEPLFGWLSRGQQLSIPMIAIGLYFVVRALRRPQQPA